MEATPEGVRSCLHRLPDEVQTRIRPLFGADTPEAINQALRSWNNVSQLWEFTKRRITEGETALVADTVQLFTVSFAVFQGANPEKGYELLQPSLGDAYDYHFHSIIGNNTDGKVTRVLLPGIMIQGQVMQKALVEVR